MKSNDSGLSPWALGENAGLWGFDEEPNWWLDYDRLPQRAA